MYSGCEKKTQYFVLEGDKENEKLERKVIWSPFALPMQKQVFVMNYFTLAARRCHVLQTMFQRWCVLAARCK